MLIDIVILPPSNIRRQLGNLAQKINKIYPSPSVVDNVRLIPHISLYHLCIAKRNLPLVLQVVKKVASVTKKFKIKTGKMHIDRISIDIEVKSSSILHLNKKILKVCAVLRTGIMPYIFKYKPTSAVKKALANFGTVGTVINYRPHVTLLVNMEGFGNKLKKIGNAPKFIFRPLVIAVCQINRWYQVTKILKQFKV